MVSDSGITKVAGKMALVTRTWVSLSVMARRRGQLHAPGLVLEADVGLGELAHDARHRPLLAVLAAGAGAAELLAGRVVADIVQRVVLQKAVQERRVRRVYADLEGLQPVGVPQALEGKAVRGRRGETVKRGEGRRRAALVAQPGKQHAGFFNDRIAALAHALAQLAAGGLGRCFQATAVGGEFPAVKRAAQAAALFQAFAPAERQVGAAVGAVAVQQAPGAGGVLEQHQVLAEQLAAP